jgi:hypothetical protein
MVDPTLLRNRGTQRPRQGQGGPRTGNLNGLQVQPVPGGARRGTGVSPLVPNGPGLHERTITAPPVDVTREEA